VNKTAELDTCSYSFSLLRRRLSPLGLSRSTSSLSSIIEPGDRPEVRLDVELRRLVLRSRDGGLKDSPRPVLLEPLLFFADFDLAGSGKGPGDVDSVIRNFFLKPCSRIRRDVAIKFSMSSLGMSAASLDYILETTYICHVYRELIYTIHVTDWFSA
jgi:hypothetical protein